MMRLLELPDAGAPRAGHERVDQPVQLRGQAVERLVEDDHRRPDLVERARGAAAELGGPPQDRDLLAELAPQVPVHRGGDPRVIRPLQQTRDPAQRHQHGPPPRLRGVRGEHGRDPDRIQRLAHVRSPQRGPHPRALRRPRRGACPPRRSPHAIPRLGQVDQLEVQPERSNDPLERRRVDRQDIERHPLVGVAPPGRDRVLAGGLDELEDLLTRLLDDDLAEERAEQPDLAREHVARPRRADAARLGALRVSPSLACGGRERRTERSSRSGLCTRNRAVRGS